MKPSTPPSTPGILAWIIPALTAVVAVAAVASYPQSAEVHAAPGSPYYPKAAQEALAGLRNTGEKTAAQAQPALPAGVSADEVYWCEQCKTYHKRTPNAAAPAPAVAADGTIPPLPQGLNPADYYWCVNCKTYHAKSQQPQAAPPADGTPRK
jgi:hypothetical protein